MLNKIIKTAYAVICTCFILSPLCGMVFCKDFDVLNFRKYEKRFPCDAPTLKMTPEAIASFPEEFEKYFNDRMGFRDQFNWLWRSGNFDLFDKSINDNNVVAGKDGWLFLGNRFGNIFSRHTEDTVDIDSIKSSRSLVLEHERIYHLLRDKGTYFLFVVAPDKPSIYPEYLPSYVKSSHVTPFFAEYLAHSKNKAPFFVNIYEELKKQKKNHGDTIYAKTDTHWTPLGAYLAYSKIIDHINCNFFECKKRVFTDWEKKEIGPGYDLSYFLGVHKKDIKVYSDSLNKISAISECMHLNTGNTTKERATSTIITSDLCVRVATPEAINNYKVLIIRDSFFSSMSGLFLTTFSNCTIFHYSNTAQYISKSLQGAHFDLIIYETAERYLPDTVKRFNFIANTIDKRYCSHRKRN